jgi:hypothetical protein
MTPQQARDDRIVDGYWVLLSDDLRLAHQALLQWADVNGWPLGKDILRFARFYGVSVDELGGLFGVIRTRSVAGVAWVNGPDALRRAGNPTIPHRAAVCLAIFLAAQALMERGEPGATVH